MRKFLLLTILGILFIPLAGIIPIEGPPIWYGQYLALMFFLFLGVSFVLWQFNKFLAIFTGLCLFSTFFVTSLTPRAVLLLFQMDLACLACYGISKFNMRQRTIILWAIVGFTLLQFIWVGVQFIGHDFIFDSNLKEGMDELVGFSGSKDQLGTYFALTTPFLLAIHPSLFIVSLLGIMASKSTFAFMASISSGLFYLWFVYKKFFFTYLLAFLIIGGIFFLKVDRPSFAAIGTRIAVWKHAVKSLVKGKAIIAKKQKIEGKSFLELGPTISVKANPIFGFGFGNFRRIFPYIPQQIGFRLFGNDYNFNYTNEKFTHAHNDFIELFFELGYIGGIIMFLLIGGFIWSFIIAKKSTELILYFSSILSYLINSTGNFLSYIAVSGTLLVIIFGMYEGTRKELNNGRIAPLG